MRSRWRREERTPAPVRRINRLRAVVEALILEKEREREAENPELIPFEVVKGTRKRLGMSAKDSYKSRRVQTLNRGKPVSPRAYIQDPTKGLAEVIPGHEEALSDAALSQVRLRLFQRDVRPFFALLKAARARSKNFADKIVSSLDPDFDHTLKPMPITGKDTPIFTTLLIARLEANGFETGKKQGAREGDTIIPILLDGEEVGRARFIQRRNRGSKMNSPSSNDRTKNENKNSSLCSC